MLFQGVSVYEVNSLAAISLLVLYRAFSNVYKGTRPDKALFFTFIAWGWTANLLYLVLSYCIDKEYLILGDQLGEVIILSLNTIGSLLFLLGTRYRLQSRFPKATNISHLVIATVVILCLLSFSVFAKSLLLPSKLLAVGFGSLAVLAMGYSYRTYFEETRQNFSPWVTLPLQLSMYAYGILQWGYFLQDSPTSQGLKLISPYSLFILGTFFKALHMFGLVKFFGGILHDYAAKRKVFYEAKLTMNLFDQIKHELATPAAEFMLRWSEQCKNIPLSRTTDPNTKQLSSLVEQITGMLRAFKTYQLFESDTNLESRESHHNINNLCDSAILTIKLVLKPAVRIERNYCSGPTVYGMEAGFYHILRNILKNAVEATMTVANGRILISTGLVPENNPEKVIIKVLDNGGGICNNQIERIFEDGVTTKPGEGRGHGLYIAQTLAVKYRGTIKASNMEWQYGRGACFELTFPYCPTKK